jgi:two-component system phosphate regulon sensor histidine kinase PhoR
MRGVIEEAVQAMRSRAYESQLDLSIKLPSDLSPAWGDPGGLRQIMDNLLDNALHYTPPRGSITVWATEADLEDQEGLQQHYLVISVRDTGVGIAPEYHERIFDKFYRVENSRSIEAGGTGMGLAVVKSLVTAHAGRIWVESKPGEGSTFLFTIPAAASG